MKKRKIAFRVNRVVEKVDSSGSPQAGAPDCRWGNVEDIRDSNSSDYRWDSWADGTNIGIGHRCYLELRGSVEIPTGMTDPVLSFWDVWDYRDPSMKAWVEVAEYDPNNDGIFDRADLGTVGNPWHTGYRLYWQPCGALQHPALCILRQKMEPKIHSCR